MPCLASDMLGPKQMDLEATQSAASNNATAAPSKAVTVLGNDLPSLMSKAGRRMRHLFKDFRSPIAILREEKRLLVSINQRFHFPIHDLLKQKEKAHYFVLNVPRSRGLQRRF